MIRRSTRQPVDRSRFIEQEWKSFFQPQLHVCFFLLMIFIFAVHVPLARAQQATTPAVPNTISPPPSATPTAPQPQANAVTAPAQKTEKIVNNPFVPGGVTTSDQMVTRKEISAMMAEQESRLRKELGGQGISSDELAKLVGNAAAGGTSNKPDNFMGCVNGTPLYREPDGTLDLGIHDPEPIRLERCGK